MKTHHILIASEQLWPNLLGLAALIKRDGGVLSLHILHTSDKGRSEQPAQQLSLLAAKMQPGLLSQLVLTGQTSQEVIEVVHSILNESSGSQIKWSINATGGMKIMFAGLAPWARMSNVEVFYREVTGTWFKLMPMEVDNIQMLRCEDWGDASSPSLDLPVEDLVTAQADQPEGAEWNSQKPIPNLPLYEVVAAGIRKDWDWRKLNQQFPALDSNQSGFAFEAFFASLVESCGCQNIALNLTMRSIKRTLQEFDLIVSTGQKIIVFDLKLTSAEDGAVIDQLSRLGEDRRKLGGLNAVAVAVRPSWQPDDITRDIARSHRVEIWTQEDMPSIVPKIRNLLGLPEDVASDTALAAVDAALKNAAKEGKRLFSQSRFLEHPVLPKEEQIGWLKLAPYWTECLKMDKQAFVLDLGGLYLIRYSVVSTGWKSQTEFEKTLPDRVKIEWFHRGKKAATAFAILLPSQEAAAPLRTYLKDLLPKGAAFQ